MAPLRLAAAALGVLAVGAIQIVNSTVGVSEITWVVHDDDDSLVTFNATCSTHDGSALSWCGFGISPTGGMWPSEAWILQASADGDVWIEDRNLIAYASPECYAVQLSSLISASVTPAGDTITAVWSRTLTVSAALIADGYLSIPQGPTTLISAMLPGPRLPSRANCSNISVHAAVGTAPGVSLLPAPAPPPGQTCIDPECMLSVGWSVSNGTIAFAATCNAPGTIITWCGFGMSPSGNMVPSEAFVLQAAGGSVWLEDRNLTVYGNPPCYPTQASTLVYSYVSPAGDAISATWTRPVTLPAALLSQGYLNIPVGPTTVIAGMLSGATPAASGCQALQKHDTNGRVAATIIDA